MDLLADLNEPQRQAVTHTDGPLLVLAGAGSGKTRVITRRVAYIISRGIDPGAVLAITFTNKAAGEMSGRVERLGTPRGATLCTFHALCARLLREFADEVGLSRNYSICDRNDQVKLVKEAMTRLEISAEKLSPAGVHAAISNAKNELKTPDAYANRAENPYTKRVANIYREYEKLLASNNALDFDDLLLRTAFLLRDRPEVRELLGRRYRYILIDEYQDTNHAQYLLAHGIAMDHQNICATGDPDQSIYAWRGADIGNILEFEQDYPDAKVVRLEENYRSTAPILAAASKLISRNAQRQRKSLWTRRAGGDNISVINCPDAHTEARQIASRISGHVAGGGRYGDVAVFYRVNSLSRTLEEALLAAGIPYRIARGVEFYNRKEIKDVLAYLKLLVNPSDDLSCVRIINTPARGIGGTTVARLRQLAEARGTSLLDACRIGEQGGLGAAAVRKVAAFAEMIASMSNEAEGPVSRIVEDVVRCTGLEQSFDSKGEEGTQARENVSELISTAAEFDGSDGGGLEEYLHLVSLVSDADHFETTDGGRGAVTLMTLHAAKGLEFPVVFIIGCEQGLLPFERDADATARGNSGPSRTAADMEEERRLAFVGMTRAMDRLFLTCARRRMIRGRTLPMAASQFLNEIGADGVTVSRIAEPPGERPHPHRSERTGRGGFYADSQERAIIEAMQDESPLPPEYEYLKIGSRVRHPTFGAGRIVKLSRPWPETRAEIAFDSCGTKKIVLSRTQIEMAY